MGKNIAAAVGIAIIIGLSAMIYIWHTNITLSTQIASVSANLSSESAELRSLINGLQGTITSLQASIAQNQQADIASAQQIAAIQASLQILQTRLSSVSSQLNATEASNSASLQQISSQLQNISATMQTLSAKVNALNPQLPQSTLVIVANSYNTTTNTFTFVVQNNQNTLVYAQISATLLSHECGFQNGNAGSYISQIYSFKPGQNTTTTLDLHLGSYLRCDIIPNIYSLTMSFIVAPNIAVSPTYTFNVVPNYRIQ